MAFIKNETPKIMTEEQIKQNAWNDFGRYTPCDENEWIDGYVVGAHETNRGT